MAIIIEIVRRYRNHKGQDHRLEGPAIFWNDGSCEWFLNDKHILKKEHPFNIFRNEYSLSENYDSWPKDKQMLFKLIYGGS